MSKTTKKEPYRFKFDTSQANLSCFIKKKNKMPSNDQDRKPSRKKSKSYKDKAVEFQPEPFLTSVLTQVFTQEFAGEKDIKELVRDIKINEQEEQLKETGNQCIQLAENNLFTERLSHRQWGRDNDSQYRALLKECQSQALLSKPMQQKKLDRSSTRICTQQTYTNTSNKSKLTPTPEQSSVHEELLFSSTIEPYTYQFYQNQIFYPSPPPQRKRKTISNDQSNQYQIILDRIEYDGRTTLMIKNIPNKYTQGMLVEELNRNHKYKYNFFYLPIDYYNNCNVGYAFVNFMHTKFINDFYLEFNGRRWNKFNSQKICSLAYARIQGTASLINHFQNSNVMHQRDKKVRPIIELGQETLNSLSKIVEEQRQQKY